MKRYLFIILSILLVLSPTIIMITMEILPDDILPKPVFITGTISCDSSSSIEFSNNENIELARFVQHLEENIVRNNVNAKEIDFDIIYNIKIDDKKGTRHIELLASLNSPSYFREADGSVHEIKEEYFDKFIKMPYAIELYKKASAPTLLSHSNEVIIPHSSSFTFVLGNQEQSTNLPTSNEIHTYYTSDTSSFEFSTVPTLCTVKAFVNGKLVFDGMLDELKNASIFKTSSVFYNVTAVWVNDSKASYFGQIDYQFYLEYANAPFFEINRTSLEAGEFLLVTANNIQDTDEIVCTLSNGSTISHKFFEKGEVHYALLPFDKALSGGNYTLSISCRETKQDFNLKISERDRSASSKVYEPDVALNEGMLSDMTNLISSIGKSYSEKSFGSDNFINYETSYGDEIYFNLGFGRVRSYTSGLDFEMVGIEFTASVGVDVHVINNGIVCASGEDAVLGKYIVVDHGYGLKSWYCNISEAVCSVGDEVKKDDVIAKTGKSAFYGYGGLYLMTTVLDTPVSPYAIYEKYFVLP